MTWLIFLLGVAIGVAGFYLYIKYKSVVYQLGENLLNRAEGDVKKAWAHVGKL